jgi:hypothetical protein
MLTKRLIRYSCWLVLSLVGVEFLMIVLDPYFFKGRFQYDPDLGFRVRAYYPMADGNLTNQFGFNDQDYPLQKTAGIYRILIVGDSFGWEGDREGNYATLLEHMLDDHYGAHRIDVINTGYPGTHTGEQLAMLKKYGLQYNPDLVILGFFAGNDFFEADPNRKRIIVNDCFFDIDKRQEHRTLGYPIITRSRLLLFLKQKYQIYTEIRRAQSEAQAWAAATGQPAPTGNLSEEAFLSVDRARLEFFNERTSAQRFQSNIDYIFQSISEMNELLKSRNIKFVVAIYPEEMQVSHDLFDTLVAKFKLNAADYNLKLAQDLLRPFLERKGIPYLDLLDRFRAEEPERELYLFRTTHWNRAGNQLAADILFDYLVRQPDAGGKNTRPPA